MIQTPPNLFNQERPYFSPEAVAELNRSAACMNRKQIRALVDRLEKKYKEDIKKINEISKKKITALEDELREQIGHFYMGSMYAMFAAAMYKARLSDRTVKSVLGNLAGTINALDAEELTMEELKEILEKDYGFKVVFDTTRSVVGLNIFEEEKE